MDQVKEFAPCVWVGMSHLGSKGKRSPLTHAGIEKNAHPHHQRKNKEQISPRVVYRNASHVCFMEQSGTGHERNQAYSSFFWNTKKEQE
jgi:hypothetical protein